MSDIALIWNPSQGSADFSTAANDFVAEDGMRTSVIYSLFTNAPARAGDVLPDGSLAKGGEGGWWGDRVAPIEGDVFGSRLWLLQRSKRTADVPPRAQTYAVEALQWLVDDKIALSVEAVGTLPEPGAKGVFNLAVTIDRPVTGRTTYRFDSVWAAEAAR